MPQNWNKKLVIFRGAGRTAEQSERLRPILDETTIPEHTLVSDMWFATVAVRDMALDPRKPADFTPVVVREEQGPTHCQFAPAERLAAWESLIDWLAHQVQPTALDVQRRCEDLVQQGAAGPCRIDPDYQIGNLYDRVKAR